MKWSPPTPLESLAMIFSELGEVAFELDKASFFEPNNLGDELADVVLRILYFSDCQGLDLDKNLENNFSDIEVKFNRYCFDHHLISQMLQTLAKATNLVRKESWSSQELCYCMSEVVFLIQKICKSQNLDFETILKNKINYNKKRNYSDKKI